MAISLKAARVNAGFTQEEAAKRIGVSETIICKWETGKCAPTAKRIPKILEVYNIKYEDVIISSS